MLVLWWVRWRDVSCGSLHVCHIVFGTSYDTTAFWCWIVLHFLFLKDFKPTLHIEIVGRQA